MKRGPYKKRPLSERISRRTAVDPETGCHVWNGCKTHDGYGRIKVCGKMVYVHRLVYELHVGSDLSKGIEVCHYCDNQACVNLEHLFLGTHKDNMGDCVSKGRLKIVHHRGGEHVNSKLVDEDIPKIRTDPRSQAKIALEYGVCQTTVSRIKRRESWSHI